MSHAYRVLRREREALSLALLRLQKIAPFPSPSWCGGYISWVLLLGMLGSGFCFWHLGMFLVGSERVCSETLHDRSWHLEHLCQEGLVKRKVATSMGTEPITEVPTGRRSIAPTSIRIAVDTAADVLNPPSYFTNNQYRYIKDTVRSDNCEHLRAKRCGWPFRRPYIRTPIAYRV